MPLFRNHISNYLKAIKQNCLLSICTIVFQFAFALLVFTLFGLNYIKFSKSFIEMFSFLMDFEQLLHYKILFFCNITLYGKIISNFYHFVISKVRI